MCRLHERDDRGPLCYRSSAAPVDGMTLLSIWPRGRRCRSKRPPITLSQGIRSIRPRPLCPGIHRPANPPPISPVASASGCPRHAGSHEPPDLGPPRDLRAHCGQPRQQNPRQAETQLSGPDRQLDARTRATYPRPRIEPPALSATRRVDRRPWEPILACTRAIASYSGSRLRAVSPCGCRVILPSCREPRLR